MAGRGDVLVAGCQPAADLPRLGAILTRRGRPFTRTGDRLCADLAGVADIDEMVAEISRTASAEKLTLIELTVTKANLEDRYLNLIPGGPLS